MALARHAGEGGDPPQAGRVRGRPSVPNRMVPRQTPHPSHAPHGSLPSPEGRGRHADCPVFGSKHPNGLISSNNLILLYYSRSSPLEKAVQHRADFAHIDAVLRMCAPDVVPEEIAPKAVRKRNDWFKPGELARMVLDVLRIAPAPRPSETSPLR
jgi:hypothetical protein